MEQKPEYKTNGSSHLEAASRSVDSRHEDLAIPHALVSIAESLERIADHNGSMVVVCLLERYLSILSDGIHTTEQALPSDMRVRKYKPDGTEVFQFPFMDDLYRVAAIMKTDLKRIKGEG